MISGQAVMMPPNKCLSCGTLCDAATSVGCDDAPGAGDITVCLYCGHIMAFDDHLRMRELTGDEMLDIAGNKNIIEIMKARSALKRH